MANVVKDKDFFQVWVGGYIVAALIGILLALQYNVPVGLAVCFITMKLVDIRGQLGRNAKALSEQDSPGSQPEQEREEPASAK